MSGVALVTSDAHTGLVEAISAALPGASSQRSSVNITGGGRVPADSPPPPGEDLGSLTGPGPAADLSLPAVAGLDRPVGVLPRAELRRGRRRDSGPGHQLAATSKPATAPQRATGHLPRRGRQARPHGGIPPVAAARGRRRCRRPVGRQGSRPTRSWHCDRCWPATDIAKSSDARAGSLD